jgi:NRAMP (natural resistance-associated macrophage protein)-like metal ion transporter
MSELSVRAPVINRDADTRVGRTKFLQRLGPGLITGAADDDPSGITTYSQVGAQFGMGMLWTMLFSFPLMAAMQEICARLGRITGGGIAENLRRHYPKPVLYGLVSLLCAANIFNLGADVTAMGAAANWFSEDH